jgi:hypothetical protein
MGMLGEHRKAFRNGDLEIQPFLLSLKLQPQAPSKGLSTELGQGESSNLPTACFVEGQFGVVFLCLNL